MKLNLKTLVAIAFCLVAGFSFSHAQDHSHDLKAPNGGRLVTAIDPHAEIFVAEDGIIKVTFLNDHGDVVSPDTQLVNLVGGSRTDPIVLNFKKEGDSLVSESKIPLDKNIPVVVQIQQSPNTEIHRERFQLNMSSCGSCEYKEYACSCH